MYYDDHVPPHFHAIYGSEKAEFCIDPPGLLKGNMYPCCDDAAEAREVVRWAKFAPLGERGFMGANPDTPYGMVGMAQYVREANEQTWLAIQIESPCRRQAYAGHRRSGRG